MGRVLYFVMRRADRILVLSEQFRASLVDNGLDPWRVQVMTTMFDGRMIEPKERTGKEPPVLLFMARFVRDKGVYELLDAIALMKDEFPGLRLIMAGDGPEMFDLKQRCFMLGLLDVVDFPGYVRNDQKAKLFDQATLFVFPSYFPEGLPNVILEAMGAGLPILANPIAAVPEVMDDPDNGLFLRSVTPDKIADSLRLMLRDPAYLADVSKRNIEKAWTHYESAVVSQKLEEVYRDVAKN
jgi:glycosyltransferase involved in cell wall biosynthesis